MVRRFGHAAGVALIPLAALLVLDCGGSDFVDTEDPNDASIDADRADGASDASRSDAGSDASSADADAGRPDADAGRPDADAGIPDAALDADARLDAALDADARLDATLDADARLDAALDADARLDAALDADADAAVFNSGTSGLMQSLGTAAPFVVLGGATVTNSGVATVLIGDVGTTGASITGLTGPPFQPSGSVAINNAQATQAVLDLGTAYTALAGRPCPPANNLTGQDLGGKTLAPGVYCFSSSALQSANTILTFDAKGDPNAVWIIQVGSALTVMDGATAIVIGGPPSLACRIFWTTGAEATINGGAHYIGNVLASSKTSMLTNATLVPGRAFGRTAGVTLLSNTISAALCP
ncbi:MAG TPA: ice-binding family protein [Polyangiaceae bacterium]